MKNITYKGILINESLLENLSPDVLTWLEGYNSLSPEEQEGINFEPEELVQIVEGRLEVAPLTVTDAGNYNAAGTPVFSSIYWNSPWHKYKANCYAHAMNVILSERGKLQPGDVVNEHHSAEILRLGFSEAALLFCTNAHADADSGKLGKITGMTECQESDIPINNQYKVALVAARNPITSNRLLDYHWYKEGVDGVWSHKPGYDSARQEDASGHTINGTNPPTLCDRGRYTLFVNYFMVTHY